MKKEDSFEACNRGKMNVWVMLNLTITPYHILKACTETIIVLTPVLFMTNGVSTKIDSDLALIFIVLKKDKISK